MGMLGKRVLASRETRNVNALARAQTADAMGAWLQGPGDNA